MARQLQVFTRLYPEKIEALVEIGQEMIDEGTADDEKALRNPAGDINTSEVIRRLLAKADHRLAD